MRIEVNTAIEIGPDELVEKMQIGDMSALITAIAERLDGEHINRTYCATQFEENMSEDAARFLAEIITTRFMKKK